MKEDDSNWFSKWAEELPKPDELMPLSQSLISPDLALAFDIPNPNSAAAAAGVPPQSTSNEFDSPAGSDEPARTLKRPRLVWTPQLHKRFVDAVAHLGIKNAVPKTIMQLMSVDGLTRENVASHLQKYRLYLKRMQGISSNGAVSNGGAAAVMDPATDHLFASSPVPPHFLHQGRSNSDHFLPYVPVIQPHPHQIQHQFRHLVNSQNPTPNPPGQFEHSFVRQSQPQVVQRIGTTEEFDTNGGRRVLTLFPTAED